MAFSDIRWPSLTFADPLQDGDEEDNPSLPMTEAVGISKGKGDGPRRCRFDASQAEAVKALRVSLHLNLAAGAIKLGENYGALAAAAVARSLDPKAVKPLYRQAQAHAALQDYPAAREALATLLEMEPKNAAARKLLETVKQQAGAAREKARPSFSNLPPTFLEPSSTFLLTSAPCGMFTGAGKLLWLLQSRAEEGAPLQRRGGGAPAAGTHVAARTHD